jgi:hypothetical protein
MKIIHKFLAILLFVGVGIVITGLFLPDKFKSVKKLQIDASPVIVFEQINNLKKWGDWFPWFTNDTSLSVNYSELFRGKGGEMSVISPMYGNCKVSLTHSVFPESVAIYFDFNTRNKTVALIYLEPSKGGTRINFTFNITCHGLWERFYLLYDKVRIDQFVAGSVLNLKKTSEALKYDRISEVKIEELESKPAIIKLDSIHVNQLWSGIASGFDYLNRFFDRRNITPLDLPFVLNYGQLNDTLVKFGVGRVVPERTWIWRTLQQYEIPGGKNVVISHYGGRNTEKAHKAAENYILTHGLKTTGVSREIALFNPETDKDSSLWEIKVYYPVE